MEEIQLLKIVDYRKKLKLCGIYCLINKKNNKKYVGHAGIIYKRLLNHRNDLLNNNHHNKYLQNEVNKYGIEHIVIEILEECQEDQLFIQEQFWADKLETFNKDKGYNYGECTDNPFRGKKHTEENKKIMSDLAKKRICTPERNKKISEAHKGKKREAWVCEVLSKGARLAHDKEKKTIKLVSPEGELIEVCGYRTFCRDYNMSRGSLKKLIKGEIPDCKGWRVYNGNNLEPLIIVGTRYFHPEERSAKISASRTGKKYPRIKKEE